MSVVMIWRSNFELLFFSFFGSTGDQRIILVLMHHTRDPDYSTAGKNWSENINNVDLDVHVLFHESVPGLLKCSQNDKAVDQIVKFLKKKTK